MDEVASGKEYVFQKDSAPAHKARKTQAWCYENLPYHWSPDLWPSSSPDSNALDLVRSVFEVGVDKIAHNTVGELKAAILEKMEKLDRRALVRACSKFRYRLEQVIKAEGGFFE